MRIETTLGSLIFFFFLFLFYLFLVVILRQGLYAALAILELTGICLPLPSERAAPPWAPYCLFLAGFSLYP